MTIIETDSYRKTLLVLPPAVQDAFAAITDPVIRNSYAAALHAKGWTFQSIAGPAGVTRERIRQVAGRGVQVDVSALPLPEPPRHTKRVRTYIEPDPVKLERLLALKAEAAKVRAGSTEGREAAREYMALVHEVTETDGVPLYRLAKRLGVTTGALGSRLVRYGFRTTTGDSKAYTPVQDVAE